MHDAAKLMMQRLHCNVAPGLPCRTFYASVTYETGDGSVLITLTRKSYRKNKDLADLKQWIYVASRRGLESSEVCI